MLFAIINIAGVYLMNIPEKSERREYATKLSDKTVLGDWFAPLIAALENVRFSDKPFVALPIHAFILYGCIRQIQALVSLRDLIQNIFHSDAGNSGLPLARSTFAGAMASRTRRKITREVVSELAREAQKQLPDKLLGVEGLGTRSVIAIDGTYQKESWHYTPIYPSDDGVDNQKGHLLLTFYDVRKGIPIGVVTETSSIAEIKLLKRGLDEARGLMQVRNAIYSVDRAFIDGKLWDDRKRKYNITVVTRMKSNLNYSETGEARDVSDKVCNEGVEYDLPIKLDSSKLPWRLIGFRAPDGIQYKYLSNDLDLEPGVIAFLYYRRWDEEKYFDNLKNDLSGDKAWSKSPVAIEQQAMLSVITYLLTRLFLHKYQKPLELDKLDSTQDRKHEIKQSLYESQIFGVAYRAYYVGLSKITRQVWRFLKNCFYKESSLELYQRQLKSLLLKYL